MFSGGFNIPTSTCCNAPLMVKYNKVNGLNYYVCSRCLTAPITNVVIDKK